MLATRIMLTGLFGMVPFAIFLFLVSRFPERWRKVLVLGALICIGVCAWLIVLSILFMVWA